MPTITSLPIQTTPLDGVPTLSSFPAGARALFVNPSGGINQCDLANLNPSIFFSVSTYGATGNGTTDDTSAIAAAITAAATSGGTIYFKPGVYLTSSVLNVPAGVRLYGDRATIKSSTPTIGKKVSIAASNVIIEGITFDGAYTGTSGTINQAYGLIEVVGASDFVPVQNVIIRDCVIQNSGAIGLNLLGNVDGIRVYGNTFFNTFCSLWGHNNSIVTTFKNIFVTNNRFQRNWGSGGQSGAVKMQGNDDAYQLSAFNIQVDENQIDSPGQMGVELWKFFSKTAVRNNIIVGAEFGISIDRGSYVNVIGNETHSCSYCGIELSTLSNNCLVSGNVCDCYTSAGARGGTAGVVISAQTWAEAPFLNQVIGNFIAGSAGKGVFLFLADRTAVIANTMRDGDVMFYNQNSDNTSFRGNAMHGPCGYHIFVDATSRDCVNIDLDSNVFTGHANSDNILYYDAGHGHTITNLRIHGNNAVAATWGNLSINKDIPIGRMTNIQCYDNYFSAGGSNADFTAFSAATAVPQPYSATLQRAGISVGAKTTLAVPSGGTPRWYKLLSADIGTSFFCQIHVYSEDIDNRKNAITAIIAGGAYGSDGHVTILPAGRFNAPIIEEIIYDNPGSGSHQDVWIRVAASSAGTVEIWFSDYLNWLITTPTAVTTEPTWASNSYRAAIITGALQVPRVQLKGGAIQMSGVGDPTGVAFAGVGSTYHRLDGGAGTSFYVKESGTSSTATGWVAK